MKYSIDLISSVAEIQNNILSNLAKILEKAMYKSKPEIETNIKSLVQKSLQIEPEYVSLISGELRYNFGLADVSSVDRVIGLLIDTLKVTVNSITTSSQGLKGGLTITFLGSDELMSILSAEPAQMKDSERVYSLPWLEWLLLKNNEILINNYDVELGPNPASRTGNAIMVRSNSSWRVPVAFAGSIENNWITRSLNKIDNEITDIVTKVISSKL